MADSKSDALLGGMIIGVAIGAIAGILATPRSGRETRRILKKSADALPELAEDLATSVQFQADRLSVTSLSNWEQTLGRLREAVVAGQAASQREWDRQQPYAASRHPVQGHPAKGAPREMTREATREATHDSASNVVNPPSNDVQNR